MGAVAILTGLGSVTGAIAAKRTADAQAQAAEYNARLQQKQYEAQANFEERKASDTQAQAEAQTRADAEKERQIRRQTEAMRGRQAVGYGASNLALDSGSALQVMTDTQVQGEQDAATFNLNSARQRFASLNSAQNQRYQAALYRHSGQNALLSGQAQASAIRAQGTNNALGSLISAKWDNIFSKKK